MARRRFFNDDLYKFKDSAFLRPQDIGVFKFDDLASFPLVGATDSIYLAKDTNLLFRWDGSGYAILSNTGDIKGPVDSVDNTIPRYDGTSGKLLQGSSVVVSDTNEMSGLTGITSSGTATLSGALHLSSNTTNSQNGDNVVITAATSNVIRLTGATLNSIAGYAGVANGRITYLINATVNPITILNDSAFASTATNRIITGTGGDIQLASGASIQLLYNTTTQRQQIVGGTGAGGGSSDPKQLHLFNAESDNVANWTPNGTSISITSLGPIAGDKTYVVSRAATGFVSSPVIPVSPWARGRSFSISNMISYNGEANGMSLSVWDWTPSEEKEIYSSFIPEGTGIQLTGDRFFIPSSSTQIRVRLYNHTTSGVSELRFDNLELNSDLLKSVDVSDLHQQVTLVYPSMTLNETTNLDTLTKTNVKANTSIFSLSTSGINIHREAKIAITYYGNRGSSNVNINIYLNGVAMSENTGRDNGPSGSTSYSALVSETDKITFSGSNSTSGKITILAEARTPSIVAPVDQVSNESITFRFRGAGEDLERYGDYRTYKSTGATYVQTAIGERPTQTDASMSKDGILLTTSTFSANSGFATPSKFEVKLPTDMVAEIIGYKDTTKALSSNIKTNKVLGTFFYGASEADLNPANGLLVLDAKASFSSSSTIEFLFSDRSTANTCYVNFTASKLAQGVAIPTPARYVVKTYQSGGTWYEVYNDGWVRQGYHLAAGTHAFLIAMRDTSYTYGFGVNTASTNDVKWNHMGCTSLTVNSMTIGSGSAVKSTFIEGYGDSDTVKPHGATPNY